jgi:hypothetical protein
MQTIMTPNEKRQITLARKHIMSVLKNPPKRQTIGRWVAFDRAFVSSDFEREIKPDDYLRPALAELMEEGLVEFGEIREIEIMITPDGEEIRSEAGTIAVVALPVVRRSEIHNLEGYDL